MANTVKELLPPQNMEAEMAVLGSMLIDEDAVSSAIESLDRAAFYSDNHKEIFEVISDLFAENKAVDLITVTNELKRLNILEQVGGASFLAELVNSVPTAANINHYVSIVKEKSILRTLIGNSTKIISLCHTNEGNIDQLVDDAERLIFEIRDKKQEGSGCLLLKEIIKDSIETIDR
ncbi:MAG: DnaB-like helicase N-terminal domain-containing protein, partial [Candidatus Omnitrophica bacterium]|nr:DnaB-like helicase N-terminal domain-containing protein [Candidatus Omnitrophota bacterium]